MVGHVMQTSVHRPVMMMFLRPVASMALRKPGSSHEFMEDRSTIGWPGNISNNCGQIYPLKLSVSTAVSTAGTLNSLATRARRVTLLMSIARSMLATPKVICGCWSMNTMAESAGVYSLLYWFIFFLSRFLVCSVGIDLFSRNRGMHPPARRRLARLHTAHR